MTRRSWLWALTLAAAGCGDPVGARVRNAGDVLVLFPDFVRLGTFGREGSLLHVIEVQSSRDGVELTLQNGARQCYSGYTGYELRVVRARDDTGREVVWVLRSRDKT